MVPELASMPTIPGALRSLEHSTIQVSFRPVVGSVGASRRYPATTRSSSERGCFRKSSVYWPMTARIMSKSFWITRSRACRGLSHVGGQQPLGRKQNEHYKTQSDERSLFHHAIIPNAASLGTPELHRACSLSACRCISTVENRSLAQACAFPSPFRGIMSAMAIFRQLRSFPCLRWGRSFDSASFHP